MYRISKKGILIIEANDSLLVRLAVKLNYAEKFELSAVKNGSTGVDDTNIPNYVYRWSEREIYKLLNSYKPEIIHNINFEYENHIKLNDIKFLFIKPFLSLFLNYLKNNKICWEYL